MSEDHKYQKSLPLTVFQMIFYAVILFLFLFWEFA